MKHTMKFKRKELKYIIDDSKKERFLKQISPYILEDKYRNYTIFNIYYDTPDFKLIQKSLEKPVYKEKMRLRSYGDVKEDTDVFLELKKKFEGIVYKRRVTMRYDEAIAYIEGDCARAGQIENELDYFLEYYNGISKAMFVSYDREAYCGAEDENLRITFDNNIQWRKDDLVLNVKPGNNTMLQDNEYVLEIKCARAMPIWLTNALSSNHIFKKSFSKYGCAYTKMIESKEEV